jgi:predicted KAP-like P-loop ATPase
VIGFAPSLLGVLATLMIAFADRLTAFTRSVLNGNIGIKVPSITRPGFDRSQPLLMDNFRDDFRTVIRTVGQKKMIVVLIDDLDRCPQNQVVPVLEAIKHFGVDDWDDPRDKKSNPDDRALIAFVLAADRRAIERAVAGHYKNYRQHMDSAEAGRFAREYVEKLVQVTFDLPPLTREQLIELLPRPEEYAS